MPAKGELWRDDGPAVRRLIDAGVSQKQWPRLIKVGDSNQLKAPSQGYQSGSPNLNLDDPVILCLLKSRRQLR